MYRTAYAAKQHSNLHTPDHYYQNQQLGWARGSGIPSFMLGYATDAPPS